MTLAAPQLRTLERKLLAGTILVICLMMAAVIVVVEQRQRAAVIEEAERRGRVLCAATRPSASRIIAYFTSSSVPSRTTFCSRAVKL